MKEFQVKNHAEMAGNVNDRGSGNVFTVKPAADEGLLSRCKASFVEVAPGNTAYGYHYHEANEEMFYIVSGKGVVRTVHGDVAVKAGDMVSFPVGEGGAHVIRNDAETETLIYIDFSTISTCEIAHLPDDGKILVASKDTFGVFDAPTR